MDSGVGSELSRAVGREAALFENESDLAGFLQRAARLVGEHSGARYCLIYPAEHGAAGPVLRPIACSGAEPERGSPPLALQAFRGRAVRRSPAGARGLALALPIALGPARIGALVLGFEERGTDAC